MKSVSIAIALTFALTGCATLFNGRKESIALDSSPIGANVNIDGENKCVTPCILTLFRNKDYTIYFEKDGYEKKSQTITSSSSGVLWVNLIWGLAGIIPLAFDYSTGGAYKLTPSHINAELQQKITQK